VEDARPQAEEVAAPQAVIPLYRMGSVYPGRLGEWHFLRSPVQIARACASRRLRHCCSRSRSVLARLRVSGPRETAIGQAFGHRRGSGSRPIDGDPVLTEVPQPDWAAEHVRRAVGLLPVASLTDRRGCRALEPLVGSALVVVHLEVTEELGQVIQAPDEPHPG